MQEYKSLSPELLLAYWRELRGNIYRCLDVTPDHLLSWSPGEKMMTLGRQFVHLATAVDWNMTLVVKDGGEWIHSDKHTSTDKAKLDEHLRVSFKRLEPFLVSDLSKTYDFKGRAVTGAWLAIHLFEHDIHHRAQIKAYLRMAGIIPPETF